MGYRWIEGFETFDSHERIIVFDEGHFDDKPEDEINLSINHSKEMKEARRENQ